MDGATVPQRRLGKTAWWTIAGIAAVVVALVVLAVAALGGGTPAGRNEAANTSAPGSAAATRTATATATAGASGPSTAGGPGATVTTGPTGTGTAGSQGAPNGTLDLCAAVDFGLVAGLGTAATQPAAGDHTDKSDYTAYTCDRPFTGDGLQIAADVTALVGVDVTGASRRFADARANAPAGAADITGVGSSAFGYQIGDGTARTYQLWALDGRTQLGVRLKVTSAAAGSPGTDRLRDTAAAVARSAIARLHT
ncbi:hypothetical protein GCM10009827_056970 [Dactylosporangium maewongense]|uniref:DUF3558 domain-containing protein n=1 Tax=Dactylosporangium maewongense TaxID=634393 RepID=A0ABP4LW58_9ACTN